MDADRHARDQRKRSARAHHGVVLGVWLRWPWPDFQKLQALDNELNMIKSLLYEEQHRNAALATAQAQATGASRSIQHAIPPPRELRADAGA